MNPEASAALGQFIGAVVMLGIFLGLLAAGRSVWAGGPKPRRRPPTTPSNPAWAAYAAQVYLPTAPPPLSGHTPPATGSIQPRILTAVALNPCNHPYDELPLDDLHDHLFRDHFEIYNLLGERNPLPAKWRKEHAADHGLVIR